MFSLDICSHPNCRKQALTRFTSDGAISEQNGFCLEHSPDSQKDIAAIYGYIKTHDKIIGINMSGIVFENLDFTEKKFYACNMQRCTFLNIHSEFCRMRMSMLDFSNFSDCNLLNSNMQFTSFAGSTFSHVLFTNSDLVHNNFNGITSHQSSFDDSDLYNSRFIRSVLVDTSIQNCNIKKTIFREASFTNVSFKQSNTREATFSDTEEERFL